MRGVLVAAGLLAFALACDGCEGGDAANGRDAGVGPEVRAHLKDLKGSVMVKRAAGDDWVDAVEQMELFENDKVRTAPGAQADVQFANGSHITLAPEALIGIAETRVRPGQDRTDVTVLQGKIAAELDHASQSLSVATPAATVRAGREIVFQ